VVNLGKGTVSNRRGNIKCGEGQRDQRGTELWGKPMHEHPRGRAVAASYKMVRKKEGKAH